MTGHKTKNVPLGGLEGVVTAVYDRLIHEGQVQGVSAWRTHSLKGLGKQKSEHAALQGLSQVEELLNQRISMRESSELHKMLFRIIAIFGTQIPSRDEAK